MFSWIFIQTLPAFDNSGKWYARWRWDNNWVTGNTKAQAILTLKETSHV